MMDLEDHRSNADHKHSDNRPSDFYQQLTPELAEYLSDLVEAALDEVTVPDTISREIEPLRDVQCRRHCPAVDELRADNFASHKVEGGSSTRYHVAQCETDFDALSERPLQLAGFGM